MGLMTNATIQLSVLMTADRFPELRFPCKAKAVLVP
jgi:hypothetical protein